MKSVRFVSALVASALVAAPIASAREADVAIAYMNCGGFGKTGTTTVIYTGFFDSEAYFNINQVSAWGIPNPQQARLENVRDDRNNLVFELLTMVSKETLYLTLKKGTHAGFLGTAPGGDGLPLNCAAKIDAVK